MNIKDKRIRRQQHRMVVDLIKIPTEDNKIRTKAKIGAIKLNLVQTLVRISIEISKIEIRNIIIREVVTNKMIKVMMNNHKSNGLMVMTDSNNEVFRMRAMKSIISVAIRTINDNH